MSVTKEQMLAVIRKAAGQCEGTEREVLEALLDEAECWRMRLTELDAEAEDGL